MATKTSAKSSFKVNEVTWMDGKSVVKRLKTRPLWGYTAYNEEPPQICIKLSGPNDMDIQKDVYIDVESLLKDLEKCGMIRKG